MWLLLLVVGGVGCEGPVVSSTLGLLRGALLSTGRREYSAFTRVPFGKPPTGRLRFRPPEPVDPWSGVLPAIHPSPICYQSNMRGYEGQEDCLYLNVYVPKTEKANSSLPVMVYFHGGGWRNGYPGPRGAEKFFMNEDVVLVMPNYRLGPFGFLSTEDDEIPGNMGLKDMALAIEWTEQNIKSFGGDPKCITAFGLSAGGASTHYLCSALRTRVLLKGCISESGVGGAFWSLSKPGTARTNAFKVANSVGCFGSGLLQCLQSKSAEDILRTEKMLKFWWGSEPLVIYGPVLERGGLLTEWPTDSGFPWLTGITSAEGKLKSGALDLFFSNKSMAEEFDSHRVEYLIKMLNLGEMKRDSAMKVYDRFFLKYSFIEGMEKLYSEVYFIHPALKQLKAHNGPKYFYVFDYTEGPGTWEVQTGIKPNFTTQGAGHGDNIFYFFDYSPKNFGPKERRLSEDLVKLWVGFARHQSPSYPRGPAWKPFGDQNSYLYIGSKGYAMKDYRNEDVEEILNFWKHVF